MALINNTGGFVADYKQEIETTTIDDVVLSKEFSNKNVKLLYEPRDILLKADKSRNWVIINVKDTGEGIDPSIMPRLFTKFASKSYQGTRLGLSIAKSIVEAHKGKIWGKNNIDETGATFSFNLPTI